MSSFELVLTIPAMVGGLIDLYVSASRIDKFLDEEEIDHSWIEEVEGDNIESAIELENANFFWKAAKKENGESSIEEEEFDEKDKKN